ncbi:hypothetical protein CCP3SC1AL1_2840001 [Gammaproteobacteria bacterium]
MILDCALGSDSNNSLFLSFNFNHRGKTVKAISIVLVFLFPAIAFSETAQTEITVPSSQVDNAPQPGNWEPWKLTLAKTITYRAVASIDDISAIYYMTGSWMTTASIVSQIMLSKSLVYAAHESAWNHFSPHDSHQTLSENVQYPLMKSMTYRIVSATNTFLMAMFFTGSAQLSSALMGIDAVYGTSIYFLHEMLWEEFGPNNYLHQNNLPKK